MAIANSHELYELLLLCPAAAMSSSAAWGQLQGLLQRVLACLATFRAAGAASADKDAWGGFADGSDAASSASLLAVGPPPLLISIELVHLLLRLLLVMMGQWGRGEGSAQGPLVRVPLIPLLHVAMQNWGAFAMSTFSSAIRQLVA
eukprot:741666-Pelagomonas_calceolata.AAC.2